MCCICCSVYGFGMYYLSSCSMIMMSYLLDYPAHKSYKTFFFQQDFPALSSVLSLVGLRLGQPGLTEMHDMNTTS